MGSVATLNHAHGLGAKMVSGNPDLARNAFASSTLHTQSSNFVTGRDPSGQPVGWVILDMLAGGVGAFSHRDGIDYGGSVTAVAHHFSDVEKSERDTPYLYLYRRELPEASGHGRWRGGTTYAAAWVGHTSDHLAMSSTGFVKAVTMGLGNCGGFPATGGRVWHATDTDIQTWFAEGRVPGGPDELRELAPHGHIAPPAAENRLSTDDVFELIANPGAGWGDPMDRDPKRVCDDLTTGRINGQDAKDIYGVVLDVDGNLDEQATATQRRALRSRRLESSRPPRHEYHEVHEVPVAATHVVEGVAIVASGGLPRFVCSGCGRQLSEASSSYRSGCRELDIEPTQISELFTSAIEATGTAIVLRAFVCPGCATILDTQLCHPEDIPYCDVRLLGADQSWH
jgi:N-methylhydantoinase B